MTGSVRSALSFAVCLIAVGCSQAPEPQGAEIATPPASSLPQQPTVLLPTQPAPTFAPATPSPEAGDNDQGPLALSSPAFAPGEAIPLRFSCDGDNISPGLEWGGAPEGTLSLALIMDDPDAPGGTWVHWVIYNLPPDLTGLPEALLADAELDDGSRQGTNSGRGLGYAGPCPPGETHRYFFKLFALDQELDLAPGVTAAELTAAMQGHILGQAELMGTYARD